LLISRQRRDDVGGFFVPVRSAGFYFAVGIVYHPVREMPADAKFRENNYLFRV
jgi:hypothetical protein